MESPSSFDLSDENILGTLWAQLLLQFSTDFFETFHMFSAWNQDVHVVLDNTLIIFFSLFLLCELSLFIPLHTKSGGVLCYTLQTLSVRPSIHLSVSASFLCCNFSTF